MAAGASVVLLPHASMHWTCIHAHYLNNLLSRPSLQSSDYSYSRVRALNATHLVWEQYSSTLGTVVDRWWLVRHRRGPW